LFLTEDVMCYCIEGFKKYLRKYLLFIYLSKQI